MKVKEILKLTDKEFEDKMTEEQWDRMHKLGFNTEQFLEAFQESARLSNQKPNEEHTTIEEYLEFWEDMKSEEKFEENRNED